MNVNVFFDIPKVQQVDLLSKWLHNVDIVALDSATCSHKWRPDFLVLLRSPELSLGESPFSSNSLFEWIILRKISFTDVIIDMCNSVLSDDIRRVALLEVLGPKLKVINITGDQNGFTDEYDQTPVQTDQLLFDLTQHCRNLTKLSIMWATLDGSLSFLINTNQLLESVDLCACYIITTSTLKSILRLPNLSALYIRESTVADFTTVPVCEPNMQCQMLNGRSCNIKPNVLSWLCQSMPNLLKLHVDVRAGSDLASIASHCRHVTMASITLESPLTAADARAIANHWQSIELLTLLRPFEWKNHPVCDESVALVFIDQCHSLLQLKLSPSDPATDNVGKSNYSLLVYDNKNAVLSKKDNARSRLTDLFVPSLSAQALATIVQKCVYLNTLRIAHPAPIAVDPNAAEFSLQHLSGTSVKTLFLVNCSNLDYAHLQPLQGMVKLVLCNVGLSSLKSHRLLNVCNQSPDLAALYIHNCPGIDASIVLGALEQCPMLTHFEYCVREKMNRYRVEEPAVSIMSTLIRKTYPNLKHFVAQF